MSRLKISQLVAASAGLMAGLLLLSSSVYAKTPEPPGLFSTLPGNVQTELPGQAVAGKSKAVQINHGRLRSGQFFVSLPGGVSFSAVRDFQHELGHNRFTWVGHADGNPDNRVIISVSGDAVAGTFTYHDRLYKLEPRANGTHILAEVKTDDPAPELDPIPVADTASSNTTSETSTTTAAASGGSVLDVLVAYTPRIESLYGTQGADALIIQAVAESNQAYANSGINTRLNLVHTVVTAYTESGNMGTDLSRLRNTSDGYMDELHSLRDSYGADLVSLIEDEPQYCGIAYRMASLSANFASSAFSVVHRSCATGYYSFAHELGHNQGAHHDHANASGAIYAYAYGHQEPFDAFRTVMAYNCSGGCTRVDYFSNPDILFSGQPTGTVDYADNALTIDNTAATVAGFRQQAAQNPPSPPSGLAATATSHSTIELDWADTSADESGFDLERSGNGMDFVQIASLPTNTSSYSDGNLLADTLYSYRARAWNSAGNSSYSEVAVASTDPAPPVSEYVASADMPIAGNISGTYQDTWSSDSVYQTIRERQSGGKKNSRYGYLEHKWVFQVQPGITMLLQANVQTTTTVDTFTFSYSTDNAQFINMFAVDANNSGMQQFVLPPSLNGTLYIRVKDSVRTAGDATSHSLEIDQLLIRSENDSAATPPSAPTNLSVSSLGSSQISIGWSDMSDNEYGFTVERRIDGSAVWDKVKTTVMNSTSFNDTGLQAATLYHYRVSAFNGGGTSAYSDSNSTRTDEQVVTAIDLNANAYKVKGSQTVQLTWAGAQSTTIDIYRNDSLVAGSVSNNGSYTDNINRKGGGSYSYEVCEVNSTNCSNTSTVVF